MSGLVTLITPTGGRPEAFARCEDYMARQTWRGDVQWLIIDDSEPRTECTLHARHPGTNIVQAYVRGPKLWRQGINTQRPNMDEALKHVDGDYIFVIEDDDYYHPMYIETYMRFLQHWPAVGEGNAKYYNILHRVQREWLNYKHASLCQTAIRRELLPVLEDAVNSGELFMDCMLWRYFWERKIPALIFAEQNLAIGMKGLPGRFGIGAGHQPEGQGFHKDIDFKKLKEWIGVSDAEWYIGFAEKMSLQAFNRK